MQKHINFVYQVSALLPEIPNHWEMTDIVNRLINEVSPDISSGDRYEPAVTFTVTATNADGIRSLIVEDIRNVVAVHDFITITEA